MNPQQKPQPSHQHPLHSSSPNHSQNTPLPQAIVNQSSSSISLEMKNIQINANAKGNDKHVLEPNTNRQFGGKGMEIEIAIARVLARIRSQIQGEMPKGLREFIQQQMNHFNKDKEIEKEAVLQNNQMQDENKQKNMVPSIPVTTNLFKTFQSSNPITKPTVQVQQSIQFSNYPKPTPILAQPQSPSTPVTPFFSSLPSIQASSNLNSNSNINLNLNLGQNKSKNQMHKKFPPLPFTSKRKVLPKEMTINGNESKNKSDGNLLDMFQQKIRNMTLQDRLDQIQQISQECTFTYDKYDRKAIGRKNSMKESTNQTQFNGISPNIQWFFNEYFYSNYDKRYFQKCPMKQIYSHLQLPLPNPSHLQNTSNFCTLSTHRLIQKSLPRPQSLNSQIFAQERAKLDQFRNQCRMATKNLAKNGQNIATDFPVHSIVLALHPLCGHLHTGAIMAYYKDNLYMIRFLKPELPAHKILDTTMSTQFTHSHSHPEHMPVSHQISFHSNPSMSASFSHSNIANLNSNAMGSYAGISMGQGIGHQMPTSNPAPSNMSMNPNSNTNPSMGMNMNMNMQLQLNNGQQYEVVENIQYWAMGFLIKLLTFKNQLVRQMAAINGIQENGKEIVSGKENIAPKIQGQNQNQDQNLSMSDGLVGVEGSTRENFMWLVNMVNKLDALIKQCLIRFRLRGVTESNTNAIFGNIKNLLLNPLKLMSKQFQNGTEQSDINASQKIREIIAKQRQVPILQPQNQIKKAIQLATLSSNCPSNPNSNPSSSQPVACSAHPSLSPISQQLLHSCLGILADLRYEGKDFDCENNGYLIKLAHIAGKDHSELFNQVYQRIYAILSKIRE